MRITLLFTALLLIALPARAQTEANGLTLSAGYTADLLRNTRGGIATGGSYLDNLDLVADVDGERLFNLPGLQIHAHVMYNNGQEFSARYSGEAQLVSNIEGVNSWRMYEFWVDYSFGQNVKWSLRAGLYDLNSEFDALDSAGLFTNASHGIGHTLAQTGVNGPSIFPVTGLAVRLRGGGEKTYWQFAAIDAVPGRRNDPSRTGFDFGGNEGALLIGELGGSFAGLDKIALGYWRYTEPFETLNDFDPAGHPIAGRGNHGWYLLAEDVLWRRGQSELKGFIRLGTATRHFNEYDGFVGTGLSWQGLLGKRPDDALGLAVAHATSGSDFRSAALAAGTRLDRAETVVELTWRAPLTDWLTLQPSVQYIRNPSVDPQLDDALAVGLRFELAWSQP
jgi:porin